MNKIKPESRILVYAYNNITHIYAVYRRNF